jgi:hypothetical protein
VVIRTFAAAFAALCLVVPAQAAGPTLVVGAVEDGVRQESLVASKAKLTLLSLAGLRAVRVSSIWTPGERAPTPGEEERLATVAAAAQLNGMRVYVAVFHATFRTTPLTDQDQADFAAYTAAIARRIPSIRNFVIGNEPNLNRFWMPQFGPDGSNAAAEAYLSLLARTYDALKAVSPSVVVIGGAVSPRGNDRPNGIRPTHSPTTFIQGLGTAYRASGRTLPVMDQFAIHPYQDNSSMSPSVPHPNTTSIGIADYAKLRGLLQASFGGSLPILYGEYGVETTVPADKQKLYTGREVVPTVDPQVQARYYREAIEMARKQADVKGIFIFKVFDEPRLEGLQSGVRYADGSAKPSLAVVQQLGSGG